MKLVQRNFLEKFLNKISNFPVWIKEIIYINLSKEIDTGDDLSYTFSTYKPALTYKGKCELDYKESNFDLNIYNILESRLGRTSNGTGGMYFCVWNCFSHLFSKAQSH